MIRYIDLYWDRFGVEPICAALADTDGGFITSRGYRAAKSRPRSARSLSDELIGEVIGRVHAANYSVYGIRKMHAALAREGWLVGRDRVGRIMKLRGLAGVRRGTKVVTTIADQAAARPADLVNRDFTATAPNQLWVADITHVPTWAGFCYVAFVTDAFSRRIVGWSVRDTLRTEDLPLEALDMAAFTVTDDLSGLVHHSDRGSQYVSIRYTDRLAELGARPSVGSVGDSYDNALAESVNGLYKTELIKPRRPWRTADEVELATMHWVWWYNHQRLHSELGMIPPIEYETNHYASHQPSRTPASALTNH
jgi:transposase InsO family protein